MMTVTWVVYKIRPARLRMTLGCLRAAGGDWPVLIVCAGRKFLKEYTAICKEFNARLIHSKIPLFCKTYLFNVGARHAETPLVAFWDADVICRTKTVGILKERLTEDSHICIGDAWAMDEHKPTPENYHIWIADYEKDKNNEPRFYKDGRSETFIMPTDMYIALKGMCEKYVIMGDEGLDFVNMWKSHGFEGEGMGRGAGILHIAHERSGFGYGSNSALFQKRKDQFEAGEKLYGNESDDWGLKYDTEWLV
jgi:hypothetical protein